MNILILSAGTRNKVVQYFKRALNGNGLVIATDCSTVAPAIYEADKYYIVPRMTAEGYIDVILDICKKESVQKDTFLCTVLIFNLLTEDLWHPGLWSRSKS